MEDGENRTKRNLKNLIPHRIVRVSVMSVCEMMRLCDAHWREEKRMLGFGAEA